MTVRPTIARATANSSSAGYYIIYGPSNYETFEMKSHRGARYSPKRSLFISDHGIPRRHISRPLLWRASTRSLSGYLDRSLSQYRPSG
jgi:hypothetical protein